MTPGPPSCSTSQECSILEFPNKHVKHMKFHMSSLDVLVAIILLKGVHIRRLNEAYLNMMCYQYKIL